MAAVNEASIRVTAETAPFQADMRKAAGRVKAVAKKMGAHLGEALGEGFDAGKQAAKDMASSVKDISTQVLTLGGAVSAGALVVGAVNAKKANIALANILSVVEGRTVSVAEAQQLVTDAAMATGESMEVIRTGAKNLTVVAKAGMDLKEALVRSTRQAQRFGVEGETMSEIWGRVIGSGTVKSLDEAEALVEQIGVTMLNTGVAMEDAFNPSDIMEFIAKMNQFGVPIQAGIVLLENMEGTVRDLGEALELPEELGEMLGSTKGLEGITAASKLTSKELSKNFSIAQNLVTVLKAGPEAFKVLQAGLGEKATIGFERLLGVDLIEAASKRKLKGEQLQQAIDKVEDAFSRDAKVQFDATAAAALNAELADTASEDFQNALTKMEGAFETEKVTEAIKKVTEKLPELADGIADFVSYAVDNPWTTVTGIVGAKLALAVGGTVVQSAVAKAAAAAFSKAAAASVLASAGGMAMQAAGAIGLGGAAVGGGAAAAGALAAGAAVAVLGVGAAAAFGFAVGTVISKALGQEASMDAEMDALRQAQFATTTAEMTGEGASREKIEAALADLASGKTAIQESQANIFQRGLAGAASIVSGEKSPEEMRIEATAKIEEESKRLIEALSKIGGAAEGAVRGLNSVKEGAGGTTRGTNHLPQVSGNAAVAG